MDKNRPFPIQGDTGLDKPCTIPWWLAEEAYKVYSAKFGIGQSLERLAERGGFGKKELIQLLSKNATDLGVY